MRLATWNCCSGPWAVKQPGWDLLNADITVVPEAPRPPEHDERKYWHGENRHKGLGVWAQSDWHIAPIAGWETLPKFVLPVQVTGPKTFLLLAVWAKNVGQDRYVRGVVKAIDECESLILAQPTVVLGDFNSNTIWDREHPATKNHSALVDRLGSLGLMSTYHAFYGEPQGGETRPTYFQHRREHLGYHIDYCFVPQAWSPRITECRIGQFADWARLSDHMPLMVSIT